MDPEVASHTVIRDRTASRRDAGFTLLEVIVATAIAALALVALFQAGSAGLLTVDAATRVEGAVARAQSHLAELADTGAIVPGETDGDDGDGYHWRMTARPIVSQAPGASNQTNAPASLYQIAVAISWGAGRHQRSVVLETERIAVTGTAR